MATNHASTLPARGPFGQRAGGDTWKGDAPVPPVPVQCTPIVKVALLDPGSDGLSLAAALRSAGFDVELAALSSITSLVVDVLVIAGDAPGALSSLRALRDDGMRPDTPVVLVGAPQGMPLLNQGPAFGADWALSREAAEHDLAHAVRSVAARSSARSEVAGLREHTFDLGEDARSQVNARVDPRALDRERQREEGDGEDEHEERDARSGEREPPSGEIEVPVRKNRTSDPAPRQDFADAGSVEIAFDAPVSPALAELLLAADRRVFPHLPPTDPSLPRGESSARELVPESLLLFTASEPEEEPALDSLTFVGAVPEVRPEPLPRTSPGLPAPNLAAPAMVSGIVGSRPATPAGSGTPRPGPDALTPAPRRLSERPRVSGLFHPSLEPTPTRAPTEPKEASGRDALPREPLKETVGAGNVLVWVRALRERAVSGICQLSLEGPTGERAVLTLEDGHVVGLVASVAGEVLRRLDGRGRAPTDSTPSDHTKAEAEAEAELERRTQGGLLSAHRLERLRTEARRDLLTRLIGCANLQFRIEPTRVVESSRPFSKRFLPLLVELAARSIDGPSALSLLVPGAPSPMRARVTKTGAFVLFARATEVSPELEVLLGEKANRSGRGDTLGELLEAGWEEPALPASLVVLAGLGALEIDASSAKDEASLGGASLGGASLGGDSRAHAVKAWLDEVSQRTEDADYFAILELPRDASSSDVVRAHETLAARLSSLHLPSLELASLEPKRRAALDAAKEAHRVLSVEHWRKAYREALER